MVTSSPCTEGTDVPLLRRAVPAALLSVALLGACGDGDPSTVETPEPGATPSAMPSATTSAPVPVGTTAAPASTLPAGVDQLVRVTVRGGEVVGGAQRVKVEKGDVVRLLVTSDVADEVHLHTYDESVEVAAGQTAALTFTASIGGVIEVELEEAGLTLVRLQIQ